MGGSSSIASTTFATTATAVTATATTTATSTTSTTTATAVISAGEVLLLGELFELLGEGSEGGGDGLNLGPEIGGEVPVGLGESVETSLDEVLGGSGVTGGRGVDIIDTGELEELLGDGSTNNTSSAGGGDELASDGTALAGDLTGNGMDTSDLVSPVASSDGEEGELGGDEGTLDGDLDFLGDLDSETDVTVVVTDGDDGLKAGSLSGLGLLLDGDDLHDLVGEGDGGTIGLGLGDEGIDNLVLLDWDGVGVDLLEGLDVLGGDESSELGLGGPLFLAGTSTATGTTAASTATEATTTSTTVSILSGSSISASGGGCCSCGCGICHSNVLA